jgi:hypothetical protein
MYSASPTMTPTNQPTNNSPPHTHTHTHTQGLNLLTDVLTIAHKDRAVKPNNPPCSQPLSVSPPVPPFLSHLLTAALTLAPSASAAS